MIVVFVVDTSPSMGLPLIPKADGTTGSTTSVGMSRLDVAKMFVEDMSRKLVRQRQNHMRVIQQVPPNVNIDAAAKRQQMNEQQRSYRNLGLLGASSGSSSLLLLSTSRQSPETSMCAVGGRLLVSYGTSSTLSDENTATSNAAAAGGSPSGGEEIAHHQHQMESFQRALKSLQSYSWSPSSNTPFPEQAGGATGLNAALSAGLQLLSRYRLQSRWTENFGLGRLPAASMLVPSPNSNSTSANNTNAATTMTTVNGLLPACLVLLTDGACLSQPPNLGGGSLQLQFGKNAPLKELYSEPFRWDQRVYCVNIAGGGLPSGLGKLCEVTGGSYWNLTKHSQLSPVTDQLLQRLLPPLPNHLPLVDPIYLRMPPLPPITTASGGKTPPGYPAGTLTLTPGEGAFYVNGGPVVHIQALEPEVDSTGTATPPKIHRAMLLYCGSTATTLYFGSNSTASADSIAASAPNGVVSPPLWPIPEAYFPNKKLDTLPPRKAQPMLIYSKYPGNMGSRSFEPNTVIKMLHRLDQACAAIRAIQAKVGGPSNTTTNANSRFLHRDVYVCEWLGLEGGRPVKVSMRQPSPEYFPVFVPGGGRPTLTEDADNYLHIGILHVPSLGSASLASSANTARLATLTMLPPEPHVLLPLLIRAVEAEHRILKKMEASGTLKGKAKANVPLDEAWRSEFRAYLFRVPMYYQPALRFALRSMLSASVLPPAESLESIMKQCFSSVSLQKIRNGEQVARDSNERIERQEASLRPVKPRDLSAGGNTGMKPLRYGQYDPRGSLDSYLSALRNMPPPWKVQATQAMQRDKSETDKKQPTHPKSETSGSITENKSSRSALDILGDLPKDGLLAFYDSRRRWLFGGTGLTTRGIHVEGVNYDGTNSQRCRTFPREREESALTLAGVGASTVNESTVQKMGDYRERLLFSKAPIVGNGANDCAGVAATTAVDGSPRWSVDDDAMPITFFDPVTGEFTDNVHARVRARLMVNFGNPYKEKRADSLIPENYMKNAPSSSHHHGVEDSTPPGSPPHDSFESSVEENEAIFVRKSPSRTSPRREEPDDILMEPPAPPPPPAKRQRTDSIDSVENGVTGSSSTIPPPPPPIKGHTPQQKRGSLKGGVPPPPPVGVPPPPPTGAPPPPPKPAAQPPARKSVPPPPPPPPPPKASVPPPPKGNVPPPPPCPSGRTSSKETAERRPSIPPRPAPPPPPLDQQLASKAPPITTKVPLPPQSNHPPAQLKRNISGSSLASSGSSAPSTSGISSTPNSPTAQELQCPDVKPEIDLPPGWMCVWSKSQKRWYFFNRSNNTSSWVPPKFS